MCPSAKQYYYLILLGIVLSSAIATSVQSSPGWSPSASPDRTTSVYVPIFLRQSTAGTNTSSGQLNTTTVPSVSSGPIRNTTTAQHHQNQPPSPVAAAGPISPVPGPLHQRNSRNNSTSTFNVLDVVRNLDVRLKNIRNVELGVTVVQEMFDVIDFTDTIRRDLNVLVAKLAARIETKLQNAGDIVANLTDFIRTNVTAAATVLDVTTPPPPLFLNTLIQPCPFDDFTLEANYNKKQIEILNYLKINGYHDVDDRNFTANTQLLEAMRHAATGAHAGVDGPNFKHVYFLSRDDHASDHNCQYYFNDLNFRRFYTVAIRGKHVFFLIDCGNSFTGEQLELSKQFVSSVVQMLSADDTVSIVVIDDHVEAMELKDEEDGDGGPDPTLRYRATMDRKDEILQMIGTLVPSKRLTNHSLGFQYAFELLERQNYTNGTPVEFVYVTRGLLSRLTEAMNVLYTIAQGQSRLSEPITINTCAVILDEKRIMYEKQFLHDIAQQNYTKYDIDVTQWYDPARHHIGGNMFMITKRHPELIIKTSTAIFRKLFDERYVSDAMTYHLPVLDYNTKDVIVAITKPIPLHGVVGINLFLNDIAEDIIYYKKTDDTYAFLIDTNGMTIYHPAYPRPVATVKPLYPVEIGFLESAIDRKLRDRILGERLANETIRLNDDGAKQVTYTWHRVLDAYIVCLVAKQNGKLAVNRVQSIPNQFDAYQQHAIDATSSSELLYHRIDLIPPPQTPVCRHFRQIATLDTGTIFLSAAAFKSPFIYMKNNREIKDATQRTHNAQSIMAYIKDMTNLLANPGLQSQIRNDVSALLHVMSYLKKRHLENGPLGKYIIRRYAATTNGVLQVYPGCILGTELEPARRPWYRKAMKHAGRTILTEPYLDAGGAGFIVTIAHTIFEGKANALHNSERDRPIAVVALDVPYAFFYKLILDATDLCSEPSIKCLLMEDEGYLIAHPTMMEPSTASLNNRRPLEHITHKESFVANDILSHKQLVRKRACASFQNRVAERYYEFNTSLVPVLTNNVVYGERTKYQIAAVPGTNVFAAVLNSTCEGGAFCPCSTVDRVCLNCNRMDQADCECPCECGLRVPKSLPATAKVRNYCEPDAENLAVVNSLSYDWNIVIKPCVSINCERYGTHHECLGVMGCEWCQLDVDLIAFPVPFCTGQNSCFNGVLGAATPYGDSDLGAAVIEPITAPAYSAFGPVGGAIIALCLVVGFAMYCYRQTLDNGSEHLYAADSMHDDNYGVPLSRFNFDDISPHDDSDLSGGGAAGSNTQHRNLLNPLTNAIAASDISPYHMSSGAGYRRPNGESDHGYSTMTPHEESEHMCFTLVEPLINNHHHHHQGKRLSMSADSMSISTSVSSPTNQPQLIAIDRPPVPSTPLSGKSASFYPGQTTTVLPTEPISPHHILVPVTVHRHMEAL